MGACLAKPKVQKEGSRDSSQIIKAEANLLGAHDTLPSQPPGASQEETKPPEDVSHKTITVSLPRRSVDEKSKKTFSLPRRSADEESKKTVLAPHHSDEQLQQLSTHEILDEYRKDATSLRKSMDRLDKVHFLTNFIM